ncbi:MAG: PRC-barrel domain-containing protein [Candidatus Zixiibacteriota bacterium]
MLRSLKRFEGYKIGAKDGELGEIIDFYFDEMEWIVRYIVADTRRWLPGRKVLIGANKIDAPDPDNKLIFVDMTKKKIKNSPKVGFKETVSKEKERELMEYFKWPVYWHRVTPPREIDLDEGTDTHLRSLNEVIGYDIHAKGEKVGKLKDIIIEEPSWRIAYLVIKTEIGAGEEKHEVLITPFWHDSIDWEAREIDLNVTKEYIQRSPEYFPDEDINPKIEKKLFEYYKE